MSVNPHLRDPEQHLIREAIRLARRLLTFKTPEEKAQFYMQVANHSGNAVQVYGPAGALCNYLERVGWGLDEAGQLHVTAFYSISLVPSDLKDIF